MQKKVNILRLDDWADTHLIGLVYNRDHKTSFKINLKIMKSVHTMFT